VSRGTIWARLRLLCAAACVLSTLVRPDGARADEATLLENPPASSADAVEAPLEQAVEETPPKAPLFPQLRDLLQDLPPFLRDSRLDLHLRTYYFDRLRFDRSENEAWAYGGWLDYQTGWLADVLSLQATVFTSQKILGLVSRDGTRLLRPDQKPYTVLGVANAQLRWEGQQFTAWRQELDLPFVNEQDSRMTPNTFDAYTLKGGFADVKYVASQVLKIKERNADTFRPLSQAAGAPGTDDGMTLAGATWSPNDRILVGAIDELSWDTFNTLYAEGDWEIPTGVDGFELKAGLQFTDQRSVGAALLPGSPFETQRVGARLALSYASAVLRLGFSQTGTGHEVISPYGTDPSFLSMMQSDFKRAGEGAWMVGLSYDFTRLGLADLSTIFYYVGGSGARSNDGVPLSNRNEIDLTIDYKRKEGRLRGLWLRFRISFLDEAGNPRTQKEMRVILNYDLPVI
jgi:hypothetical protein